MGSNHTLRSGPLIAKALLPVLRFGPRFGTHSGALAAFSPIPPTTVLDAFLKSIIEDKRKIEMRPANFYPASIYAWNAYREDKTITTVKYYTKKGLYPVAA